MLRALPRLKDELRLNVELASPGDFIPLPSGWQERSPFVGREGRVTARHFDLYSQALAKVARNHELDRVDVRELLARAYVEPDAVRACFEEIEPQLYRFPAVEPHAFRANLERALTG